MKTKAKIEREKSPYSELSQKELLGMVMDLEAEIEDMKEQLERASGKKLIPDVKTKSVSSKATKYNVNWTWTSKIVFVLMQVDRPAKSKDILELISNQDKSVKRLSDGQKIFSTLINRAVEYNRISAHKIKGCQGSYYILPEWLDDKKRLKPEYLEKIDVFE